MRKARDALVNEWAALLVGGAVLIAAGVTLYFVLPRDEQDHVSELGVMASTALFLIGAAIAIAGGIGIVAHLLHSDVETPMALDIGVSTVTQPDFDPLRIVTEVYEVDLSGLDSPESLVVFTFTVRNYTGYAIEITGMSGEPICSGQPCTQPLRLRHSPVHLPAESGDQHTCEVMLPIGDAMAGHMLLTGAIDGDGILVWQLGGLTWEGSANVQGISTPLRRAYASISDLVIRGPIGRGKVPGRLLRFPATFGNSEIFDSNGVPKPSPQPET